jgi:hypothetical protein
MKAGGAISGHSGRICEPAASALLVLLFMVNVYRAKTQSITGDEAFTYNVFLSGSVSNLFKLYNANHHVFYNILAKISILVFGLSEFTLRIPSLLGGALYLTTAFRLSRFLFGRGWLFLLSAALLSLNPFLLDYMSVARGYGLALAFFLWSLYQMLRYLSHRDEAGVISSEPSLMYWAAVGLALSVASNLTLLLPATVLALLFVSILLIDGLRARDRKVLARRFHLIRDSFIVPGIAIAFVILVWPLVKARMDQYYVGQPTLAKSLESLVNLSFFNHPLSGKMAGILPGPQSWLLLFEKVLVPAALVSTVLVCAVILYRWFRAERFSHLEKIDQFLFLGGGATLGALALLVAAHRIFGLLYPHARTGLYFVPLFVLTCLALWKRIENYWSVSAIARWPLLALALLCILQFGIEFQTNHYGEWRYDANTKEIVSRIRALHSLNPAERVRVGVSWILEPSMNFYRRMYGIDWIEPLDRKGPAGTFDYYVLQPFDISVVERLHLTVLYKDKISENVLAVPATTKTATVIESTP